MMPVVLTPKITEAGEVAAFNSANNGLELELTHISFGSGAPYTPTGSETALVAQDVLVPISAGSRIKPNQIRVSALWQAESGIYPINEVGFWAGSTLFAVWSDPDIGTLAYKTAGLDFVFFYDLAIKGLPASSITVVVDPQFNQFMTALGLHMNAQDAHPYYLRTVDFAREQRLIWAGQAGGTANAVALTLPADTVLAEYEPGIWFRFIAGAGNTGPMTANVSSLGPKPIKKNGTEEVVNGDVVAGAVYEIVYDGTNFQLAGGVGGTGTFTRYPYTVEAGQTSFPASYTVDNLLVKVNGRDLQPGDFEALDGANVIIPSVIEGDEVLIVVFGSFEVANTYTKAEIDLLTCDATTAIKGITRYATNAETIAGTEPGAAVTPPSLAALTATTTRRGLVELATNAETSGTSGTLAVTPSGLNARDAAKSYTSPQQVMVSGGAITVAHQLGAEPEFIELIAVAKNADAGYAIGDRIRLSQGAGVPGANGTHPACWADETNIYIRFHSISMSYIRKDNGVATSLSYADWNLIIKARL